jgi:hypothetical protein
MISHYLDTRRYCLFALRMGIHLILPKFHDSLLYRADLFQLIRQKLGVIVQLEQWK